MDWYKVMEILTPILATLLVTLISWGVYELKKYVRSKTDSQLMINAADSIGEVANTVVHDLQAKAVDALKQAGQLTPEKAAQIKADAIAKTKALLTEQTIKVAAKSIADLDQYISGKIEQSVTEGKILKEIPASSGG